MLWCGGRRRRRKEAGKCADHGGGDEDEAVALIGRLCSGNRDEMGVESKYSGGTRYVLF